MVFHAFPNFTQQALGDSGPVHLGASQDVLKVLLVASGTFTWTPTAEAVTTVTQFLAGSGSGALTECTGGNYSRVTLTAANISLSTSGTVTTLNAASPSFVNVTLNTVYAMFYDYTAGGNSDTNGIPICYWDFGGSQAITGATFTLTISASGLVTWTST